MLKLLNRMSEDPRGRLIVPSDGQWDVYHHVELLVDARHSEWAGTNIARITNAGYDFLNAATNPKTGKRVWAQFVDLFNKGVPYARAAQAAVDLVGKATGT